MQWRGGCFQKDHSKSQKAPWRYIPREKYLESKVVRKKKLALGSCFKEVLTAGQKGQAFRCDSCPSTYCTAGEAEESPVAHMKSASHVCGSQVNPRVLVMADLA